MGANSQDYYLQCKIELNTSTSKFLQWQTTSVRKIQGHEF